MDENLQKKYIPMTETTYYTLLAVTEPRHGYVIMQYVRELTKGRIVLGTGTLYTMAGRLVADGVIVAVPNDEGKKAYRITGTGEELLKMETQRLHRQLEDGESVLSQGGALNRIRTVRLWPYRETGEPESRARQRADAGSGNPRRGRKGETWRSGRWAAGKTGSAEKRCGSG